MQAFVYTESAAVFSLVTNTLNRMPNPKVVKITPADDISSALRGAAKDSIFILDMDTGSIIPEQIVKQIKNPPQIIDMPLIILTSKKNEMAIKEDMRSFASSVLFKPMNPDELLITLQKASRPVGAAASVDVSFVNPFVAATVSVFETMASTKVIRKDLFLKKDYKSFGDVSGIMGLVGEANGSVVLSLPMRTACKVVARMLGEEVPTKVTENIKDGVGEIVNIISGQAKAALAQTKNHFTLSIPTVVAGAGHEIMHKKGAPCIVVVFDAEGDLFALQVCLASSK